MTRKTEKCRKHTHTHTANCIIRHVYCACLFGPMIFSSPYQSHQQIFKKRTQKIGPWCEEILSLWLCCRPNRQHTHTCSFPNLCFYVVVVFFRCFDLIRLWFVWLWFDLMELCNAILNVHTPMQYSIRCAILLVVCLAFFLEHKKHRISNSDEIETIQQKN